MDQILVKNLFWNSITRGLGFKKAWKQLKMAIGNPSPLVVESQTIFYIKIWTIVMKYTDFQLIWRFKSMIF